MFCHFAIYCLFLFAQYSCLLVVFAFFYMYMEGIRVLEMCLREGWG